MSPVSRRPTGEDDRSPDPTVPRIAGREHQEERGERVQVEVEEASCVEPRIGDQEDERSKHDGGSGKLGGPAPRGAFRPGFHTALHDLGDPPDRRDLGADSGEVLQPQQQDPVRVGQIEQGDGVEQQPEVVVQVRVAVRGDERVQVPVCDEESSLVGSREVDSEPKPRVLVRAHEQQDDCLQPEDASRRVPGDTDDSAFAHVGRESRRHRPRQAGVSSSRPA